MQTGPKRFFVGVTGASGHPYWLAVVRALLGAGQQVDLSITAAGRKVAAHELGMIVGERGEGLREGLAAWCSPQAMEQVRVFAAEAVEAPPSSGTALTGGVILVPCSMGTMARVSAGYSSNLIERAADVALKEGRSLLLVPREAPYSAIHLENMLRLARLGAVILPASPGFYHRPKTIEDLVMHLAGKVLDRLGVAHSVGARWQGLPPAPPEDQGTARSTAPEEH